MEASGNQRDLVFKIKCGSALRRFSAHVNGNHLDYDISTLNTKIIRLFELSEDANLLLTYTDIDGDVVTLSTDDELFDAAIYQCLNPLRINVCVKGNAATNNFNNGTTTAPSGTLPGLEILPSPVNDIVQESLRSIPDPVRTTLSKISEEVSKVAATSPVVNELVEFLSRIGQSHFGPLHVTGTGSASNPQRDANNNSSCTKATGDLLSSASAPHPTVNLFDLAHGKEQLVIEKEGETRKEYAQDKGKSIATIASLPKPTCDLRGLSCSPGAHVPGTDQDENSKTQFEGDAPSSNLSDTENVFSTIGNSTFSGHPFGGLHCPLGISRRESFGAHDSLFQTFHKGISCDGCGMHPIMGPRYKSKVQENFDLCNICFSEIGNEIDYIRIDRPTYCSPRPSRGFLGPNPAHHAFRGWGMRPVREKLESRFIQDITIVDGTSVAPSTAFTKIWRMRNSGSISWPKGTYLVRVGGDVLSDKCIAELDIPMTGFPPGEEIDIAVDFLAPSKAGRYISYWKLASPQGQKFGQRVWVLIHVGNYNHYGSNWLTGLVPHYPSIWDAFPQGGLNAGEANFEPVVEVQHVSPDPPVINVEQVKASSSSTPCGDTVSSGLLFQGAHDTAIKPVMPDIDLSALYHAIDSSRVSTDTLSTPFIPYPVISMPMPSTIPKFDSWASYQPASPEFDPPLSYPVDPLLLRSSSPLIAPGTPLGGILDDATELALLRELEKIGFKEIDLNKEILRKNDYDLDQSVDDLCSIADWHPLLEELQVMGFHDKEKNIKLLAKNGGSLKHAVLSLISGDP